MRHLRESGETAGVYVADSGLYSEANLHHLTFPDGTRHTQVLRLNAVHWLVLRLLGPAYEDRYLLSSESVK